MTQAILCNIRQDIESLKSKSEFHRPLRPRVSDGAHQQANGGAHCSRVQFMFSPVMSDTALDTFHKRHCSAPKSFRHFGRRRNLDNRGRICSGRPGGDRAPRGCFWSAFVVTADSPVGPSGGNPKFIFPKYVAQFF